MKVKAITPHGNPRGEGFWKEAGAVYELPDIEATGLIAAGLVEEVKASSSPTAPLREAKKRGKTDAG